MPVVARTPMRSRRGRQVDRVSDTSTTRVRSKSPARGQPTPSARGGRSRALNELDKLAFASPGRKNMFADMNDPDSPSDGPRRLRTRHREPQVPPEVTATKSLGGTGSDTASASSSSAPRDTQVENDADSNDFDAFSTPTIITVVVCLILGTCAANYALLSLLPIPGA